MIKWSHLRYWDNSILTLRDRERFGKTWAWHHGVSHSWLRGLLRVGPVFIIWKYLLFFTLKSPVDQGLVFLVRITSLCRDKKKINHFFPAKTYLPQIGQFLAIFYFKNAHNWPKMPVLGQIWPFLGQKSIFWGGWSKTFGTLISGN